MARRHTVESGFTLVELMASVTVFAIVLVAFLAFFRSQAQALAQQERFMNAKQNAQIGLDFMMRELRTAGSRPMPESYPGCGVAVSAATVCYGTNAVKGFPSFAAANGTGLRLYADYRGDAAGNPPDGCPDDAGEDVTYAYDAGAARLMRTLGSGTPAAILEGIMPSTGFRLRYYGYDTGSPPAFVEFQPGGGNLTADEIARLTHIVLSVTTRAASRIQNAPAIVSTQTSTIDIRNPGC